jgi:hypothetical protein
LLCAAHHVITHALGYLITPTATGGFAFTRPDGQRIPHSPALPGSDGDPARCHDADITTETIIAAGLGDKLDLDLAIWACLANARTDQQQASQPATRTAPGRLTNRPPASATIRPGTRHRRQVGVAA